MSSVAREISLYTQQEDYNIKHNDKYFSILIGMSKRIHNTLVKSQSMTWHCLWQPKCGNWNTSITSIYEFLQILDFYKKIYLIYFKGTIAPTPNHWFLNKRRMYLNTWDTQIWVSYNMREIWGPKDKKLPCEFSNEAVKPELFTTKECELRCNLKRLLSFYKEAEDRRTIWEAVWSSSSTSECSQYNHISSLEQEYAAKPITCTIQFCF